VRASDGNVINVTNHRDEQARRSRSRPDNPGPIRPVSHAVSRQETADIATRVIVVR
jgi:hypothetical protein